MNPARGGRSKKRIVMNTRTLGKQLFAALAFSTLAIPLATQAETLCPGPNPGEYALLPYHFKTNSRIERLNNSREWPFATISCIANVPPYKLTYTHWLIPGINGWLDGEAQLRSTPRRSKKPDDSPTLGCLEYGNRGDAVRATFFANLNERGRADHEKAIGCRQAIAENPSSSTNGPIEDIIDSIMNYFPSAKNHAGETMLRFMGKVGVKGAGGSYVSFLEYTLEPYRGSKGQPDAITITPVFAGPTESLWRAFLQKNERQVKASKNNRIVFEVSGIRDPQLRYATYNFYDQDHQLVGSIDFPVFISSPK